MNNEPVAWYAEKNDGEMVFATSKAERGHLENKGLEAIPLYTHPAKTLTDEEIGQIWKECMESPYMQVSNPVGFARAILRKAQEK